MYAADIRAHLNRLHLERVAAESAGLTKCAPYMADLEDEISEYRAAFVGAAVTEIAVARGELSGRPVGSASRISPRRRRPRTAFALVGRAGLGAMQVGMLRALYERGIAPDVLVGTSAEAPNATFVASRPQTVSTANQLGRAWGAIRRGEIFPVAFRTLLGGVSSRYDHLVPDVVEHSGQPASRLIGSIGNAVRADGNPY